MFFYLRHHLITIHLDRKQSDYSRLCLGEVMSASENERISGTGDYG